MYAVFEDGSRQYRVSEGDVVKVDYRDVEIGSQVEFKNILLFKGDELKIGQPHIDGARVLGEVVGQPSTKVYVQHFRRRKNYRRFRGHRQHYLAVRIRSILLPGMEPPPAPEKTSVAPPSEPAVPPESASTSESTAANTGNPTTSTSEPTSES